MACENVRRPNQSLTERIEEVRKAIARFSAGLAAGTIKARVGPQGAIAFDGISAADRDGVTDACAYRQIMVSGTALAKAAIARAEALAGRTVDRKVLAAGVHAHDGVWHHGHKH